MELEISEFISEGILEVLEPIVDNKMKKMMHYLDW